MSLSGERNVFVDARAVASSSISATDKENSEEGGEVRKACSCTATRP